MANGLNTPAQFGGANFPSQNGNQPTTGQPANVTQQQNAVAGALNTLNQAQNTAWGQTPQGQKEAQQQVRQQLNSAIQDKSTAQVVKNLIEMRKAVDRQRDILKTNYEATKKDIEERKRQVKENTDLNQEETARQLKALDELAEKADKQLEQDQKNLDMMSKALGPGGAIVQGLIAVGNAMKEEFTKVIKTNDEYRHVINTRLQGLTDTQDKWSEMQYKVTWAFGTSLVVNEQKVLATMKTAVENGIAFNVEQRAMLQTLSQDIANTFNAFSNSLTRLIRLQQSDVTTLALGMESSLTTTLNRLFQDTSYLNNERTAQISDILLDAMSQMNPLQAEEFNYTVQKYLGSLYSLGMSDTAITSIAEGIGRLYSGNITGISSQMNSLLAMSAARSGQSYADILRDGIDKTNINKLMYSMVEYLAEIAEQQSNVVEATYGQVFGMSVSDLRAATNLVSRLGEVYNVDTSAQSMVNQTGNMIATIADRLGIAGMMQTLIDNFSYSTAANLVGNQVGATIYQIIDKFGSLIDFAIPSISAAGFGISFEGAKVTDIMNAAIGGLGLLSGIATLIGGITSGNFGYALSEDWWNTTGITPRGTGLSGISGGAGSSYRAVAGGAGSDIARSEIKDAGSYSQEIQGTEAQTPPDHTTDDLFDELQTISNLLQEWNKNFFGPSRKPLLVDINGFVNHEFIGDEDGEKYIRTKLVNTFDEFFTSKERLPNDVNIVP